MSTSTDAAIAKTSAAYTRPGPPGSRWLRRLWPFIRHYRCTAVVALVTSVVAQVLIGMLPLIQQVIVDHGIVEQDRRLGPLLMHSGPGDPDLDRCWRSYLRRFDIEHTFRFAKSTLGWTSPSLCTPEQADRWTSLVIAALTQLRLARGIVHDLRLPWERPLDITKLTPARVRRGFRRLRAHLGTPANPPKPSRARPGRPKGTRTGPRPRHPAIKKAA